MTCNFHVRGPIIWPQWILDSYRYYTDIAFDCWQSFGDVSQLGTSEFSQIFWKTFMLVGQFDFLGDDFDNLGQHTLFF